MRNIKTRSKKNKLFQGNESNRYNHISISLEDKITFLKFPQTYIEKPNKVEVIETHMSWVFLTQDFVYKLKKPVRSDSLDYSTVLKRKKNCHTEILLNKRLAPDIYLGITPITVDKIGKLTLEGKGKVVDWLVKMRRLPRQYMLDYAIQNQTVKNIDIINFTKVLSKFYIETNQIRMTSADYCSRFEKGILKNCEEISSPQYQLSKNLINSISTNQLDFLMKNNECLAQRAIDNKIVDAHGDLRPEHICLLKEPVIIDCLEFSRELRILDPVDELSFLALECERLGSSFVGKRVLEIYSNTTNDFPPVKLIHFYKSYRACVRAKLAIWHLKDSQVLDRAKWVDRANEYLNLATKYAHKLNLVVHAY
ncbi:MAG: hypothetical protein ACR2PU_04500 [Gammaproteobacteria bacterium]